MSCISKIFWKYFYAVLTWKSMDLFTWKKENTLTKNAFASFGNKELHEYLSRLPGEANVLERRPVLAVWSVHFRAALILSPLQCEVFPSNWKRIEFSFLRWCQLFLYVKGLGWEYSTVIFYILTYACLERETLISSTF